MKPAVVTRATLSLAWTIILIAPLAMPSAVGVEALAPGAAMQVDINDGGAAWTPDEGNTWFTLPGVSGYWAVAFASPKAGWLVGTDGRILKISF